MFYGGLFEVMKVRNPFRTLSRFEWLLWITSLFFVSGSCLFAETVQPMTLAASLIGVTALIFIAKGNVLGQLLTVLFSLLYAAISLKFRYYGEMITYLGMTAPIAALSVISWLRHPYQNSAEVEVHRLSKGQIVLLILLTVAVTGIFYFILAFFHTANLRVSTVSVATSFLASGLMFLRSPYYALAYGANDLVLIGLWALACTHSLAYLPMVICFLMFFFNDLYGFYSWRRMKRRQAAGE